MKSIVIIVALFAAFKIYGFVKNFFLKYEVLVFTKEDIQEAREEQNAPAGALQLRPDNYNRSIDLRGTPTHLCPCGSNIWNLKAIFEDFEISTYFLDMECVSCGSVATAPTPVDRRAME